MQLVREAFRRARLDSVRHMHFCEDAGIRWGETAITEVVMSRASTAVTVVPFTQRAEALSGADWVWWWVDSTAAYGMLVQAKRVAVSRAGWTFDFGYRTKGAPVTQRQALMDAAAALDLAPVYALYLGTPDYRDWRPCPDGHRSGRCLQCHKRSVSLMPALLADSTAVTNATSTYARSIALEDLWRPARRVPPVIPALRAQMSTDLFEFLTGKQEGVRAVTRSMVDRILTERARQFVQVTASATSGTADGRHDDFPPIFRQLPADEGHWGVNYFEQALGPLLGVPPSYVLDAEAGEAGAEDLGSNFPESVAGIVVVRTPQNG